MQLRDWFDVPRNVKKELRSVCNDYRKTDRTPFAQQYYETLLDYSSDVTAGGVQLPTWNQLTELTRAVLDESHAFHSDSDRLLDEHMFLATKTLFT